MPNDHYTVAFSHTPWRDNVDTVQAEGDSGLNKRFTDIKQEFDAIQRAIESARDRLAILEKPRTPVTRRLNIAPFFFATDTDQNTRWQTDKELKATTGKGADIHGVIPIQLPEGATLKSLLVKCVLQDAGVQDYLEISLHAGDKRVPLVACRLTNSGVQQTPIPHRHVTDGNTRLWIEAECKRSGDCVGEIHEMILEYEIA